MTKEFEKLNIAGLEDLNQLDEKSRELALRILKEYSDTGYSEIMDELTYEDYRERPVDIITFIKDPNYLGKAWHLPSGKCKLFPYWEKRLQELFPDPVKTEKNNVILSGARGLGKSEIAITIGAYLMYRLMCLKNPYEVLNLKPTEKVAFAFMNITEILAEDIGISKFQATVQASPWFMSHGTITGKTTLVWNPPDFINIIIGSQPRHVIGQAIYFAFFDEISFIANQDIEKQKEKAIDMIDTAIGGMATRFTYHGKNPTVLVLASSKRSEKSFLETHTKKKLESEKENLLLVDEPVWNVRPPEEYSGKRFLVAEGNKFLASIVLPERITTEELKLYKDKGYKILEVPVEYRAKFLDDIDRALCDYAGVSSSDLTKYIAGFRLTNVRKDFLHNPMTKEVIEVGNAPNDKVQYYQYFDATLINPKLKAKPLFVHLDMSMSGDKTGIAGTWIVGKKPTEVDGEESKDLFYQLAFSFAVKAPKGYQVSFEKNRNFIRWLREQGFNVCGVSCDTFQSADLVQQLKSENFNVEIISVDRVDTDHVCKPYHYLRNTIYEERIQIYDSDLLFEELVNLERDSNGRIDHPDGGRTGSKDIADALCGSVYNASKHGEEYAYNFGEDLEEILTHNSINEKQQVTIQLEEEMKTLLDPVKKAQPAKTKTPFMDFGLGAAQETGFNPYVAQGIMYWGD